MIIHNLYFLFFNLSQQSNINGLQRFQMTQNNQKIQQEPQQAPNRQTVQVQNPIVPEPIEQQKPANAEQKPQETPIKNQSPQKSQIAALGESSPDKNKSVINDDKYQGGKIQVGKSSNEHVNGIQNSNAKDNSNAGDENINSNQNEDSDGQNEQQKEDEDRSSNNQDNKSDQDDGQGQDDQDQQPEDSNIKSDDKDQQNKSSGQQDTKKQQQGSGKKCFNKLCNSKKLYKKLRSKVQHAKYRFLCKTCYENYLNNSFCQFCQQIYSNNGWDQDDDQWIGCDQCDRWNHIECEKKYRNKNISDISDQDSIYRCLVCSYKTKNNNNNDSKPRFKKQYNNLDENKHGKQKFEISKDQRVPIFNKKIENLPSLEYFLQNYNFRLWLNENLIRQDMETLRAAEKKSNQQEFKKNKKVKTD